ncbi:phytanoyl-CoA dioxygenase family protein [Botrimarina mediterranea]|uniref:Phytanoyl-CoA dioxygenase (PhyH) n=1 Tax=Botrimarina mediterranea TaxID=2528022 RepID=A0A518K5U2_9BACT|nr:phytanoyl-CoA dioxygenase family protein [Botrimarina mediterranea]QDV73145.1 Phytanoyl-CoA dioxygenase (PhyH) [Botrimarina mediterranea]
MADDLSHRHGPITGLFGAEPLTRLSADHVAAFESDGFIGGVRLLTDQQIESLRAELADLMRPEHSGRELWYEHHANESSDAGTTLFHALGGWRLRPALHDILWSPTFVAAAERLLNGPIRFWHDQLFCKPAHDGGVVAWHQDYSYWTRTVPMQHLTCWIGLDDSTLDNGCVHYVPGSHRWPLLPRPQLAGDMEAIRSVLTSDQLAEFQPAPCEMRAGEASFHHPLMLHGSYENRSDRPRRAIVLNVVRDGTVSDQDSPLLEGVDAVPRGEPLSGRFFPLLSS